VRGRAPRRCAFLPKLPSVQPLRVIQRFYEVRGGRILIDGQDIAGVAQDSLRAAIAVVPQDPSLFHRSAMENIRYGRSDATDAEVVGAAVSAKCRDFIEALPHGLATIVGHRGAKLSGGQRQPHCDSSGLPERCATAFAGRGNFGSG
jgi:ABC-type multidrug transport system fused ATPase/permease subunit